MKRTILLFIFSITLFGCSKSTKDQLQAEVVKIYEGEIIIEKNENNSQTNYVLDYLLNRENLYPDADNLKNSTDRILNSIPTKEENMIVNSRNGTIDRLYEWDLPSIKVSLRTYFGDEMKTVYTIIEK